MLTFEYDRESELRAMRLDGIEEGIEKGRQEGMQDIIYRMLSKGKSVEEVSELIGIPIADIQKLLN